MKRLSIAAALVVAGALSSAPAQAKLLDIYAGPRTGMVTGWGDGGMRGLGFGVELGAELLLFDLFANHTQVAGGDRSGATSTQFLLGVDGDFGLDGLVAPRFFLRVGGAAGLGLLTDDPVDLPIDNRQLSHKGVVVQGTAALEYHVNRFVIAGVELVGGYSYLWSHGLYYRQLAEEAARSRTMPGSRRSIDFSESVVNGGQFTMMFTIRAHFEPLGR